MRRWPQQPDGWLGPVTPPIPELPGQPRPPTTADTRGDAIRPFFCGDGLPHWIVIVGEVEDFDPRPAGIQLVCSQYVPQGFVGFLKQVRVGPYLPAQLGDPWATVGALGPSWRTFNSGPPAFPPDRAGATNGIWTTPCGWKSYQWADEVATVIEWEWLLRVVPGDVAKLRQTFDPTDPATWAWQPLLPVPLAGYPSGIPAGAIGFGDWGPSPFQVLPDAPLQTHALVPEDSSLCLFTRWRQGTVPTEAAIWNGASVDVEDIGPSVYPLLPSYGQLHGYMQPTQSNAGQANAVAGWGG